MKDGKIDQLDRVGCQCPTRTPPFKTAGLGGIRLGRQLRWLELLIKHAAILDLGGQSRLARMPLPSQMKPPFRLLRRLIYLKSTQDVKQTVSTKWILISVARSRPGSSRQPQVAFLESLLSGVDLAKKSYQTQPKE